MIRKFEKSGNSGILASPIGILKNLPASTQPPETSQDMRPKDRTIQTDQIIDQINQINQPTNQPIPHFDASYS